MARLVLVGLLGGALLLLPAPAAGEDVGPAAGAKPPGSGARHKVSPYARAGRAHALEPRPEHRPNLRLTVRGVQRARGR